MLAITLELLSWLQPEASSPGGASPDAGAGGGGGGWMTQIGFFVLMIAVFYFLLIRPQQKRQREHDSMLKALKKGVVVRTTGGIRGEILDINDREVTLLVAEKTKLNVLRSHIAGPDVDPGAAKSSGKDKDKS